jgi:hypothetical protein
MTTNVTELKFAPKVNYVTLMNLKQGDQILTGNMYSGFGSWEIVSVEESGYSKRMARVTIKFNHGGIASMNHGKNARWAVIAKEGN